MSKQGICTSKQKLDKYKRLCAKQDYFTEKQIHIIYLCSVLGRDIFKTLLYGVRGNTYMHREFLVYFHSGLCYNYPVPI